ncbi:MULTISPECIES: LysE family translocator [Pseudomonas]|uniref:Lysine transporter LysE n=1 Tax=Pseudomonas abyssi TaxID=170540 RepID=A0A2A3MJ41_9PSED|nr:LysE family translocator [Pseudomonas abyssi]MAD01366.1 LysE family translocator [Pseudomonadales bacterium]PBK04813.1 lysine transporter LysE [Pseudomonas abyssi]
MTALLPFLVFAFVASITPGPTNLLAMSSSARFGLRASLPIVLGGCAASAALVLAVGLGAGAALLTHPEMATVFGWAGALWLSWLGWKIATGDVQLNTDSSTDKPLGAAAAALMQLINPKPWTVALAVVGVFMSTSGAPAWMLALLFLLIAIPCMLLWAWLGLKARHWLHSRVALRRFNQLMGVLLAGSGWLGLLG